MKPLTIRQALKLAHKGITDRTSPFICNTHKRWPAGAKDIIQKTLQNTTFGCFVVRHLGDRNPQRCGPTMQYLRTRWLSEMCKHKNLNMKAFPAIAASSLDLVIEEAKALPFDLIGDSYEHCVRRIV